MILVIDDEESNRLALERIFTREGWPVRVAADGRQGLEILREGDIGVVVSDLKMPGMGGLELLRATRQVAPQVQVILVTAYGTVESAVEAMKEGAYDFVTKPLRRTEVIASVRKALEKHDLLRENLRLRQEIAQASPGELIGQSGELRALMEEARQVAPSMASVLLTGESGTGKGLLARWIHTVSARPGRLVTVNCGALPENLLESELFGYEAGAFTGAHGRKEGRFDLASGGTIFLDEVTEIPLPLQVKLLRVLQDGEYERLGGTRTIRTEVRVVAATNRDPEQAVAEGRLRPDLYYRLNVIRLHVPALRERRADIALLARHFASTHGARNGRVLRGIEPEALAALERHPWPGNVRELENAMERAAVLAREDLVRLGDLPPAIRAAASTTNEVPRLVFTPGTPLRDVERRMIEATLRQCNGDRSLAANLLGITARTIYRREAEWRDPEA
ncbi:MAG: sigma-54 dependent transcriptional regulator [Pseudomonadota bacterium]|nr:sigma-54 dependent transcriptional regulator [Pseudomonadota bacterium]